MAKSITGKYVKDGVLIESQVRLQHLQEFATLSSFQANSVYDTASLLRSNMSSRKRQAQ